MTDQPLVSVMLTVYNKPQWLRQCVDSVLRQTYDHLELIVLEDNSPDPSVQSILESYREEPRVILHFSGINESERYATARYATLINHGVRNLSHGSLLTYLADDDFYYPNRLQRFVATVQEGFPVVYGSQAIVDVDGNVCNERPTRGELADAWDKVDHNSVLHTRQAFDDAGGWPDNPGVWGGADAWFWRRLTDAGYKFHPVEGGPYDAKRYHKKSVQWLIANDRWPCEI